jgi:hypothetical protein
MTDLKLLISSTTAAIDQVLGTYSAKRKSQQPLQKSKRLKLHRSNSDARAKWGVPVFEIPDQQSSPLTPMSSLEEVRGAGCRECYERDSRLRVLQLELMEYKSQLSQVSLQLVETSQDVSELQRQLQSEEDYRQSLHRHLQSLRGNMRIYCRIKPSVSPALELARISPLRTLSVGGQIYTFDRVFSGSSTQTEVYSEVQPFIQSFVDGDDVCIFCYGQTGSGKTYTLEGLVEESVGVLPRAANDIFLAVKAYALTSTTSVKLAACEIYLDELKDLIQDSGQLKLMTLKNKTSVAGLTWHAIKDTESTLKLLSQAAQNRVTRGTLYNALSSRSHCIYQISLLRDSKTSTLNIVDLAGSERSNPESYRDKTRLEVEEMKQVQIEASSINKSLSCLRRVVSALAAKHKSVPPFRESKLTRVLQDSLSSAEAKVVLFVNICDSNDSETRESLKFSEAAQRV